MFSGGVVGKFGEEKVNPLSVPASNGCKSKVTSCFHFPPSHRFRPSTPTNQSGLGISFTIRDSSGFLWVRSTSVELWPMPDGIPAVRYMEPTDRLFLASFASFTRSTVSPCSAKLFMPSLAGAPSCHSRYCSLWVTTMSLDHCAGGRNKGYCLGKVCGLQCPVNTTM